MRIIKPQSSKPKTVYIIAVVGVVITCAVFAWFKTNKHVPGNFGNADTSTIRRENTASVATGKNNKWVGNWQRNTFQSASSIMIKKALGDSIIFSIDASSGGDLGQIEGKARVENQTAIYLDKENGCRLTMRLLGDSVINIDEDNCTSHEGIGVEFAGIYKNSRLIPAGKKTTKEDMVSLEILNKAQNDVFKTLVDTGYSHFVECTQLVYDDEKDLDGFNAKVVTGAVQGMFTYMEQIIMIDNTNQIWAAYVKDGKIVHYYTNSPDHADKLPLTINHWLSRFTDYKVVFESKK